MDAFQASPYEEFTESELLERVSGPICPAAGSTSSTMTWPTTSGLPGESVPTYPYGHWRIRLDLTITSPSTASLGLPSYFRQIHIIMCRCKEGEPALSQAIYPTPENDARVVNFERINEGFWGLPSDFPHSDYLPDPQVFDRFLVSPVIYGLPPLDVYDTELDLSAAFYTWRISAEPSETYPKQFVSEILVREPTPWCQSVYFPLQYSALATFSYSLSITRET